VPCGPGTVAAGHGAPFATRVALDEVEDASGRVAGAKLVPVVGEKCHGLLGDARKAGCHA